MKKIHVALFVFLLCLVALEAAYITNQSVEETGKATVFKLLPNIFTAVGTSGGANGDTADGETAGGADGGTADGADGGTAGEEQDAGAGENTDPDAGEEDIPDYAETIHVLILNESGGALHSGLQVSGTGDFSVTAQNGESVTYPGGTVLGEDQLWENGVSEVTVRCLSDGALQWGSGGEWSLEYGGSFSIAKQEDGASIVNEVDIEQYVCGVLPSEMPDSFGTEALKAQAVCARSYAYVKTLSYDYPQYGAQVDDSVMYQVYNRQAVSETAREAVAETEGLVLASGGRIAEPFYFSTSWGYTSDVTVWGYRAEDYPYLQPVAVALDGEKKDFSDEAAFTEAIMGTGEDALEKDCRYFRWQAEFSMNQNTGKVEEILRQRSDVLPGSIRYFDTDSGEELDTVGDFGKIVAVNVTKRGISGAAVEMAIRFEHCRAVVENEYSIRSLMAAMVKNITYGDGSAEEGVALLPSAYFTIYGQSEQSNGTVYGGGLGHGVGMSQNGADLLAANGYGCEDILRFFYQGVQVEEIKRR